MSNLAIELLNINLKHHKERIKNYSKPISSNNDYIQNQLTWHVECKNNLEEAIKKLKS